jgi:hypothetical protein
MKLTGHDAIKERRHMTASSEKANTSAVEIARRSTADGKHVCLWSDGALTWALGYTIKGSAQPRTSAARDQALRAGWLVLGDVCLYDASEVTALIKAARWAAARDGLPGTMRRRFKATTGPALRPDWHVVQTDRSGRPTVRVWRLSRLGPLSGLALWDEPHRGFRYHLLSRVSGSVDTFTRTGYCFKSIHRAIDHLESLLCDDMAELV